jgi:t-SNARE complex subunit (syntaxin)
LLENNGRYLNDYRSTIDAIGTPLDNMEKRNEAGELRGRIHDNLIAIHRELEARSGGGRSDVMLKRLAKQLSVQRQTFEDLTKSEKKKLEANPPDKHGSFSSTIEASDGSELVVQQQIDESHVRSIEILERQAEDIRNLERDITDLREIGVQLNVKIADQGEVVEKIDDNIEHAAVAVEVGAENASKAAVLSKKNRIIIAVIVGVVIAAVVVAVLVLVIVLASVIPQIPGQNSG